MAQIQQRDSFTSDLTKPSAFKLRLHFVISCGKTNHPFPIEPVFSPEAHRHYVLDPSRKDFGLCNRRKDNSELSSGFGHFESQNHRFTE